METETFENFLDNYLEANYTNYSSKNKASEIIFVQKIKRMIMCYFKEEDKNKNIDEIKEIFASIIQDHYDEILMF